MFEYYVKKKLGKAVAKIIKFCYKLFVTRAGNE